MILYGAMARSRKKPAVVDEHMEGEYLLEYFAALPDPRLERSRLHPLPSMLALALIGVVCGADSFVAIEAFGVAREEWLKTFLDLPNGIPSHDTMGRVFAMLDSKALQAVFRRWMASVATNTEGDVVALDGKTLRRSFRKRGDGFVHMVSAWSAQNRLVLGQLKTDAKSNEITALPQLLELLQLKGCTVTVDAMGCQKEVAQTIVDAEADYMLAVKDNQPTLASDIRATFDAIQSTQELLSTTSYYQTEDKGHGRSEVRRCWTTGVLDFITQAADWPGLCTLVMIESRRTVAGKTSVECRYYICSRLHLSAAQALSVVRSHWGIENELHWVLDVAFREDDCRVRVGNAAENVAVLRHLALNLLKAVTGSKLGIKNRRLRAAWDNAFLLRVLGSLSQPRTC